jgi:hypothetical protein
VSGRCVVGQGSGHCFSIDVNGDAGAICCRCGCHGVDVSVAVTEEGTGWDDFGASSLMLHAVTGAAGEAPGLAPGHWKKTFCLSLGVRIGQNPSSDVRWRQRSCCRILIFRAVVC